MSWLDALKKEIGDFKLGTGIKEKAEKKTTLPRDNVIKLINDNIKLLGDSSYLVKTAKGAAKKPERCFESNDGKATVWISYSRQKLKLDGDNTVISGIDDNKVLAALNHLKQAVESGVFDAQLDSIKSLRSEAQKKSKASSAKK